ncbi:hypothetical protein BSR23_007930 [Vibrio parahaemolyticus]|nr:hypothetical protein BSR23_007930 [Vibrio parahaemolyticus]
MLKCNAAAWSLRASPLNWALVANGKNVAKAENLGLMNCAIVLGFVCGCGLLKLRSIVNAVGFFCRFRR